MTAPSVTGAVPRAAAARALKEVLDHGHALGDALSRCVTPLTDTRDRALARRLCNRVLRDLPAHEWRLARLLQKPLQRHARVVHCLLLAALDQLVEKREPVAAVIHASVAACRTLDQPRLTGLVNAVLRNYGRRADRLEAERPADPAFRLGYPEWLTEQILEDWPTDGLAVLEAGNQSPPTWLRPNLRRTSAADLSLRLAPAGVETRTCTEIPTALKLTTPRAISALPGYAEGLFSVQDAGAQLAAGLLELEPGLAVLDACAAPGGKAAHILETAEVELTAVDIDPERAARVESGLGRLGLRARVVVGDATRPGDWSPNAQCFDRILIDAPCSGTGVIRRHPDIRWLRRAADIPANAQLQRQLLEALWPRLRTGGLLVYATCSVLHAENRDPVRAFIERHPEAELVEFEMPEAVPVSPGVQVLPGSLDRDGFYYAGLRRMQPA